MGGADREEADSRATRERTASSAAAGPARGAAARGAGAGASPPPAAAAAAPSGYDAGLDFFSPAFDALRALYTPRLQPPDPRVKALEYLTKCRFILPAELPESLAHVAAARAVAPLPEPAVAPAARAARAAQAQASTARKEAAQLAARAEGSVLDRVAERAGVGPLALLKGRLGQRVRLVTRHRKGVRGVAEGTLVAFDRFLNLVLRDASESYTVLTRVPRPHSRPGAGAGAAGAGEGPPGRAEGSSGPLPADMEEGEVEGGPAGDSAGVSGTRSGGQEQEGGPEVRWFRKQEHRNRHLPLVFVRGDAVVSLNVPQGGGGAAAAAAPVAAA